MAIEYPIGFTDEAGIGQLVDPRVETSVGLFVHLQGNFPESLALHAPYGGQMLDGQTRIADHLQHFGEAAGLMNGLDNQNLGYLHDRGYTLG